MHAKPYARASLLAKAKVSGTNGILVETGGRRFAFDPASPTNADYVFVSHAHMDHVHRPSKESKVLASKETRVLASARGYDLGETLERTDGISLLDSGHIFGARAIAIGDEVLYTGDAAGRERGFLSRCRTRKAKVLIMETTFGLERYSFPPISKVVEDVNTLIASAFDKGRPVVLMGYPLGKSQTLSYLFASWSPFLVHERVAEMSEIHRQFGVKLKEGTVVGSSMEGIPEGPWVMIAPMMTSRNKFLSALKKEHGAISVAFSGWAIGSGYAYSVGADRAFPISDHCDYAELKRLVKEVSPETVYTTHGFAEEFARDLRGDGYDAKPLAGAQSTLSDY